MNKPTILFILNPTAGTKKKITKAQLSHKLREWDVTFIDEVANREIKVKNYINEGGRIVVVMGGDGTVNDIGSILMNTPAKLGILPTGSGNGLARDLGIPMDIDQALNVILKGREKKIDVGFLNGRPFFCTAGIGFDAICAYDFAHKKHHRGLWNYIKIIFENYFSYIPIEVETEKGKATFFSVTFANARQFGNNAYIAPDAVLNDGFLDVSMIFPHPKSQFLLLGWGLMKKSIGQFEFFKSQKVKSFRLNKISDKRVHLDGESVILEEDFIDIKVANQVLNVIV